MKIKKPKICPLCNEPYILNMETSHRSTAKLALHGIYTYILNASI